MNLLAPVSNIMTKDLITVSPNDPLSVVNNIFAKYKIHHIPVVQEGELAGIISQSDFLFFKRGFNPSRLVEKMEEIRLHNYAVKDIMTTKLATLDPRDKIIVALDIFLKNIFHAIPVVDSRRLVGIVTTHDVIKELVKDKHAIAEYDLK
ncbi:MAG TPA: CBS domain-containing protein [Saprospiraceae bacterium]|nr:CBS domain-containing protein [Saprospiraceae bacterium]